MTLKIFTNDVNENCITIQHMREFINTKLYSIKSELVNNGFEIDNIVNKEYFDDYDEQQIIEINREMKLIKSKGQVYEELLKELGEVLK